MEDDLQCRCQTENRPRCLWQNLSASQARHLSLKGEACSGVTDKQKGHPQGASLRMRRGRHVPVVFRTFNRGISFDLQKSSEKAAGASARPTGAEGMVGHVPVVLRTFDRSASSNPQKNSRK